MPFLWFFNHRLKRQWVNTLPRVWNCQISFIIGAKKCHAVFVVNVSGFTRPVQSGPLCETWDPGPGELQTQRWGREARSTVELLLILPPGLCCLLPGLAGASLTPPERGAVMWWHMISSNPSTYIQRRTGLPASTEVHVATVGLKQCAVKPPRHDGIYVNPK